MQLTHWGTKNIHRDVSAEVTEFINRNGPMDHRAVLLRWANLLLKDIAERNPVCSGVSENTCIVPCVSTSNKQLFIIVFVEQIA
jgi:hypothetical protein